MGRLLRRANLQPERLHGQLLGDDHGWRSGVQRHLLQLLEHRLLELGDDRVRVPRGQRAQHGESRRLHRHLRCARCSDLRGLQQHERGRRLRDHRHRLDCNEGCDHLPLRPRVCSLEQCQLLVSRSRRGNAHARRHDSGSPSTLRVRRCRGHAASRMGSHPRHLQDGTRRADPHGPQDQGGGVQAAPRCRSRRACASRA